MSTYPRWKDGVRLFFLGLIGSLGHLLDMYIVRLYPRPHW